VAPLVVWGRDAHLRDKLEQLTPMLGALTHGKLDVSRNPLLAVGITIDWPRNKKSGCSRQGVCDKTRYTRRVPLKWVC
jgi:hypothetical protein